MPTIIYRRAWIAARKTALTREQQNSPLAKHTHDLRHTCTCLSLWLNGGVAPTQVAGHSAEVVLPIYAKRIDCQQEIAKRRIADALRYNGGTQAADTSTHASNDRGESEGEPEL